MTAFVLLPNLGSDFDVGTQVANKLNVVMATTGVFGKMRFATATEIATGKASVAIDAATNAFNMKGLGRAGGVNYNTIASATAGPGGVMWLDGGSNPNGPEPTSGNGGTLIQFDPLYSAQPDSYKIQLSSTEDSNFWFRYQTNGTWNAWQQFLFVGQAVDLTSAQTVAGTKTFTLSPQVPTAASGDSGPNAASTAFVASAFASAALGALLSQLPTTLPSTTGLAWLNGGVLEVS